MTASSSPPPICGMLWRQPAPLASGFLEMARGVTYLDSVLSATSSILLAGLAALLIWRLIRQRRQLAEAERRARNATISASDLRAQFLANISHEIRTPMNAVVGMTGLLLDTKLDDNQRELAETVRRSADALLAIIN